MEVMGIYERLMEEDVDTINKYIDLEKNKITCKKCGIFYQWSTGGGGRNYCLTCMSKHLKNEHNVICYFGLEQCLWICER